MNQNLTIKERAYNFSLAILTALNTLPHQTNARIIGDQLMRASFSIGANLVEGSAASSRKEFKRYQEISLKSANEARYWLRLAKDGKLLEPNMADELEKEVIEISNMIGASVIKLKQQPEKLG